VELYLYPLKTCLWGDLYLYPSHNLHFTLPLQSGSQFDILFPPQPPSNAVTLTRVPIWILFKIGVYDLFCFLVLPELSSPTPQDSPFPFHTQAASSQNTSLFRNVQHN